MSVTDGIVSNAVPRPSMRDTPAEVESILRSLPGRFRPEHVDADDAGTYHFVIAGAEKLHWTICIAVGSCTVEEGLMGEPVCTVSMSEEVFIAIETGRCNPVTEFLQGKIKVTNVGRMRRYERAFYRFSDVPESDGSGAAT